MGSQTAVIDWNQQFANSYLRRHWAGHEGRKRRTVRVLAAAERYLKIDHSAESRELERRVESIRTALKPVKGITTERHVPVIANGVPHVSVQWDEPSRGLTSQQVVEKLLSGDPPIHVQRPGAGQLLISVWMMRGDEHVVVGRRLREILSA